jgi:hypothetical protein
MPAMAPPERLEEVWATGGDVDVVEVGAEVGDEEAGVVVAVVLATWATPKAKPS